MLRIYGELKFADGATLQLCGPIARARTMWSPTNQVVSVPCGTVLVIENMLHTDVSCLTQINKLLEK